jgi:hypothetical protein
LYKNTVFVDTRKFSNNQLSVAVVLEGHGWYSSVDSNCAHYIMM